MCSWTTLDLPSKTAASSDRRWFWPTDLLLLLHQITLLCGHNLCCSGRPSQVLLSVEQNKKNDEEKSKAQQLSCLTPFYKAKYSVCAVRIFQYYYKYNKAFRTSQGFIWKSFLSLPGGIGPMSCHRERKHQHFVTKPLQNLCSKKIIRLIWHCCLDPGYMACVWLAGCSTWNLRAPDSWSNSHIFLVFINREF